MLCCRNFLRRYVGLDPFFLSLIPHFSQQYGKAPAQILIRWSLQHGCAYILTWLSYER